MYLIDMHVHTAETSRCGMVAAQELVMYYHNIGYQGLIITDHYYRPFFEKIVGCTWEEKIQRFLKGYHSALKIGEDVGMQIFLGMEIQFEENPNDYLIYGIDEAFLIENPNLYSLGLKKFRSLTKDQGIMIFQAHPFRVGLVPAEASLLDGVEVYNGNQRHNSHDHLAVDFAREHHLLALSASDYHQEEDLGQGGIVLSTPVKDWHTLSQVLKEGKYHLKA